MSRTGIFLCTCDGKVNKAIDVNWVAQNLASDARFISITPHLCLPDGMRAFQQKMAEEHPEHVVVAACPARFQEKHLRAECERAGVKHFALVDWREGCAYAHRGDKDNATNKARTMVEMGIAHATNAREIQRVQTPIVQRALVIGGGIAGMTAALELAARGISVTLVEREPILGGQLNGVSLNGSTESFAQTKRAVTLHPHITLYLNSRLTAISSEVGNYRVAVAYPNGSIVINVGAIVLATGAQEFNDPHLYRHDGRRVVTLSEFETQISNLQSPLSLLYLLCAGSRDAQHPYCSNVCCLGALHQALRVKREHPETRVTILFRDLYLLGDEWNEQIVLDAQKLGIEFLRYAPNEPPRVEQDGVVVRDRLTGLTRRIESDRVILATPLVPRDDAGVLARWLKLPRDENGFFLDPHYRVRPEAQIERGIFLCGSAHRPVDFDNAILQGKTAAARAGHFLQKHFVTRPGASAFVNADLCTGCAQCVETCAFGAIEMWTGDSNRSNALPSQPALTEIQKAQFVSQPTQVGFAIGSRDFQSPLDRAHIDPFLCLACGNCVVACPSKAIDLPHARDAQIFAQIDAALREPKSITLVFGCTWSGHAAMELAGARRMNYSANVRVIELPCSARLDPLHVLYALVNGADHVLLALCPPDECHFGNGNRYAEMRIENLRAQLTAYGIDPQRVQYARLMGDDANAWVKTVRQISNLSQVGS